jgi:RND family efflux transporter MFP subunit
MPLTMPDRGRNRKIDVGSLVQADATSGTFMFTLTQSDVMRIRLYVPQDAAIGVKPGVDAVVRVPEIPDHTFPGKVARIADALDPATRNLMTEIDVPNPDGELSPGTYCTVELKVPRRTPSLIVPAGAIVFDRDGLHVLVVENGIAHSRKITEIRDLGTEVEVSQGVKQGDQVVLTPPVDLEDGGKVQIRATSTATASSSLVTRPCQGIGICWIIAVLKAAIVYVGRVTEVAFLAACRTARVRH